MKLFERVRVATTLTGTGPATCNVSAISAEYRTLAGAGAAVGDTFPYEIGVAGSAEWEGGLGTITAISSGAVTFSRAPTASSNGGALVNFSTGTKEVVCTPLGATLTKWENGTSVRVVVASAFLVSDSTLGMTPTLGANQTAKIQALLDLATSGPLRLIIDVACTVDDLGVSPLACLFIRSNTELVFMPNCGFVLRENITKFMFSNKNPTIDPNARVDKNIMITGLGGILHGNRDNQPVRGQALLAFNGVDNLFMIDPPEIRKAKQFAWRAANCYRVRVINARVDFGAGSNEQNTDGYHFNGPCDDIVVRDYTALNCGDDPLAFNADDAWGEAVFNGPLDNVYGPITNVYVDGVYTSGFLYGIRLLSGASRIDNVFIRNVRGQTGSYSVVLDNYVSPDKALSPGPGNFGTIVIDGLTTRNTSVNAVQSWTKMGVHLNAKIEQIKLLNIIKKDFNNEYFPMVRIGEKANIDQLQINLDSRNYNGGTYVTEQIDFAPGAIVSQADIKVRTFSSSAVNGSPVRVQSGATISMMTLDGQAPNFTSMLNKLGTVTTLFDRTVVSTVTPPTSTWTLETLTNNNWKENTSDAGYLGYVEPSPGKIGIAKKNTADGFGGNVKISFTIKFTRTTTPGTFGSDMHAAPLFRGSNMIPWSGASNQNCYGLDIGLTSSNNLISIGFFKKVAGVQTDFSRVSNALSPEATYSFEVTGKSTTMSVVVKRASDNLYLQPNGSWSGTATAALTVTDTSLAAASGDWGFYGYNEASANSSILINNIAIAAAP